MQQKKKLGGGVILTQIHEIDYFLHLFRGYEIVKSSFISSKISDLKIDVEDVFSANFLLKKDKMKIMCSMNLNFFEKPKKRKFSLIGEKASLEACFNSNTIIVYKKNKKLIKKFKFKKNEIFIKELRFFISKVKAKRMISNNLNIHNGIKTLRFALDMKKNTIIN